MPRVEVKNLRSETPRSISSFESGCRGEVKRVLALKPYNQIFAGNSPALSSSPASLRKQTVLPRPPKKKKKKASAEEPRGFESSTQRLRKAQYEARHHLAAKEHLNNTGPKLKAPNLEQRPTELPCQSGERTPRTA